MNELNGLKIGMISLGCVKNRVDSEQMLSELTQAGMEITHEPKEADDLAVVIERLSAPHEDDVTDRYAKMTFHKIYFAEDLRRGQIPYEAADRRSAEPAAHPAADLCGNADGITEFILHKDRFD